MFFFIGAGVIALVAWRQYGSDVRKIVEDNLLIEETRKSGDIVVKVPTETGEVIYFQDAEKTFQFALFSSEAELDFLYTPREAQSLVEQSRENEFVAAINGSYFIGSYVESSPSGLLQIKGELISEYVPNVQISHVVVYDHVANELKFIRARNLDLSAYSQPRYSLAQTGPLLIDSNQVQFDFIDGALNSEQESIRSFIGITDAGEKFIGISRTQVTLYELVDTISANPLFQNNNITVVNLDGGASTAMFVKDSEALKFREQIRLPLVIGLD